MEFSTPGCFLVRNIWQVFFFWGGGGGGGVRGGGGVGGGGGGGGGCLIQVRIFLGVQNKFSNSLIIHKENSKEINV